MKKPIKERLPLIPPHSAHSTAKDYKREDNKAVVETELSDMAVYSKLGKLSSLVPIDDIEWSARNQIYACLAEESLIKLAIMPDVHAGYDLPIGGVALLNGMISPSYVGYDIGCGMCSVNTGQPAESFKSELKNIYDEIIKDIPTGFSCLTSSNRALEYNPKHDMPKDIKARIQDKAVMQMGTLGGGNHFIEIGENTEGKLCVTVHSGSRNVGHTIGDYYMKQGRMFPVASELGLMYKADLDFALEWALLNRITMIRTVLNILGMPFINSMPFINENHNHAEILAEGVLHRKGATPADKGQKGIIPANMRDGVFITVGTGNKEFLSSASHGCGRTMGRNVAKKTLDYDKFVASMAGIVCSTDRSILDEAPDAYKDPDYVIKAQEGVVINVIDHIRPLINIKAAE